ncbi:glutathione transferase GstA [Lysobacter sp. KIS68-7]|uniref:glutathione transferase GstA n=1 Tax=Lysobacter sp. KIS68-7 TaxID=2904252 RepID=UPI001E47E29A|nr:glutathione transferase GstA [Lysobacter sp. KIS68-7]UHQ19372.1 glutathione transferase GstA [Lysobacter sp. KIS68-7]
MKLFYAPAACSLSPHIALREAGAKFTLEKVDLQTKKTEADSDFLGVNPKGYVPALQLDGGEVLTEGTMIVQYIADLFPKSQLVPAAGTPGHYKLLEWLGFISCELQRNLSPMFNPALTPELKESLMAVVAKRLDWLAAQLEGKTYLVGDRFTVADGYLFTILNWSNFVGLGLSPWKTIQEYMARIGSRPSVVAALKAEGLTPA